LLILNGRKKGKDMINRWGVKNFKSILNADLELAPLTVFTGINSSGKSSFLQSIVLTAQAARKKDSGKINIKGDLLNLGKVDYIYHKNSAEKKEPFTEEIGISCVIPSEKNKYALLELGLSRRDKVFSDEENLSINRLVMGCGKEDKDSNFLKYTGEYFYGSIYDIWQELKSNKDCNNIDLTVPSPYCIFDRYSFLPDRINFYRYFEDNIYDFLELLVDFPEKELADKKEALKYTEEKISDLKFDKRFIREFLIFVFLLPFYKDYVSSEDGKMGEDYDYEDEDDYEDENDEENENDVDFELLSSIEIILNNIFGENILNQDNNFNYKLDIELADWYLALSKQDKQIRENLRSKLARERFRDCLLSLFINFSYDIQEREFNLELPDKLKDTRDLLYDYFKLRILYLGPLRVDPKWDYKDNINKQEQNESDAEYEKRMRDVGVKGENTMSVIKYFLRKRHKKIKNYYSPDFFENPDHGHKKERVFAEGLMEWLNYFELSDDFINDDGKDKDGKDEEEIDGLILFKVVKDGQEFFLPQMGTGVSQILPILVMCLAADENTTLIIQEPEQNLHPKLQSRLADFFIAMSLSGRQCLIETHSEYIIEQIRCRIVEISDRKFVILPEHEPKFMHEHTKFYFVTKENCVSHFKDIVIDKHAFLDDWPDDFFDVTHKIIRKMMEEVVKKEELNQENG
jgi:predicted ATPase